MLKKARIVVIIAVLILVVTAGSFYLGVRFVDRLMKSPCQNMEDI
ncbi:hypothetical protein [Carnobacterium mobile]|nr:hypothetical protein [Carnobacterium mobile]